MLNVPTREGTPPNLSDFVNWARKVINEHPPLARPARPEAPARGRTRDCPHEDGALSMVSAVHPNCLGDLWHRL